MPCHDDMDNKSDPRSKWKKAAKRSERRRGNQEAGSLLQVDQGNWPTWHLVEVPVPGQQALFLGRVLVRTRGNGSIFGQRLAKKNITSYKNKTLTEFFIRLQWYLQYPKKEM